MSECLVPGQPASESLPQLVYDQQLAEQAQRWANNCTINHDKPSDRKHPKWKYVGQNWAADHSYESSFNAWFVEHMNYTFDTMKCDPGVECGHYTQIVSARTTHIGCGSAMCKKSVRFPWRVTVTCNYGPNGNVIWAKSEAIRCGKQICKNVPNVLFDGVIVCNYGPAGNLERENALMKRKIMTNLHYRRQQQQLQRQQKKA
ncbi:unnamed protein product [Fasciola hepatica]|uniref:SCP domain-containing protein n=1 Tax=Fasciola hepatica TaxID=6192 RepID=A0ABC9HH98_FASHE